jgi:hypothetical protein
MDSKKTPESLGASESRSSRALRCRCGAAETAAKKAIK